MQGTSPFATMFLRSATIREQLFTKGDGLDVREKGMPFKRDKFTAYILYFRCLD